MTVELPSPQETAALLDRFLSEYPTVTLNEKELAIIGLFTLVQYQINQDPEDREFLLVLHSRIIVEQSAFHAQRFKAPFIMALLSKASDTCEDIEVIADTDDPEEVLTALSGSVHKHETKH